MSSRDPATKMTAPTQKNSPSLRYSKYTRIDASAQSETPAAVRAFGVTRVRVSPTIEREA